MNGFRKRRPRPDGFTLIELMVTIVIVAVLATLAFLGFRRARETALMSANMSNLRSVGVMVTTIAQEQGGYPAGWNFGRFESWADLVVEEMHGGSLRQDPVLLSPLVARDIPGDLNQTAISNYAVSPFVFPQGGNDGKQPYKVTPARLQRPSEQILLGDALPRSPEAPYGFSMIVWWGLRTTTGNSGTPPVSPESRASAPIRLPDNIAEMTDDGGAGLPAFRNRGRGHFLFADGHVQAMEPDELKFKHFAISY